MVTTCVVALLHGWMGSSQEPWMMRTEALLRAFPTIRVVRPEARRGNVAMRAGTKEIVASATGAWFDVDVQDDPAAFDGPAWEEHCKRYGCHGRKVFSFMQRFTGMDRSLYEVMRDVRAADPMGRARVVLVGHSMGAFLALYAASKPATDPTWEPAPEDWQEHLAAVGRIYACVALHGLSPLGYTRGHVVPLLLLTHEEDAGGRSREDWLKDGMGFNLQTMIETIGEAPTDQVAPPHIETHEARGPTANAHAVTEDEVRRAVDYVVRADRGASLEGGDTTS